MYTLQETNAIQSNQRQFSRPMRVAVWSRKPWTYCCVEILQEKEHISYVATKQISTAPGQSSDAVVLSRWSAVSAVWRLSLSLW